MNIGYNSNLQDICKNMAVFIFKKTTLDVLGLKDELAPKESKGKLGGCLF